MIETVKWRRREVRESRLARTRARKTRRERHDPCQPLFWRCPRWAQRRRRLKPMRDRSWALWLQRPPSSSLWSSTLFGLLLRRSLLMFLCVFGMNVNALATLFCHYSHFSPLLLRFGVALTFLCFFFLLFHLKGKWNKYKQIKKKN